MKTDCLCEVCPPVTDKRYTHQENYEMEGNRPNTKFLAPESNTGTTNKPSQSGLVIRQPL